MTKEEMFEVFGDFDPNVYEAEVEERWAGPALEQSRRRARTYGKDQWQDAMAEGESITEAFAALLRAGDAPQGMATMDVAEQLQTQEVDPTKLTLIGESFGNYVNHQVAKGLGGVNRVLAFNPANELGG